MSYSSTVKSEILKKVDISREEKLAELSAILYSKNSVLKDEIEIRLENVSLAKRVYAFLKDITPLKIIIKYLVSRRLGDHNVFIIKVVKQKGIKDLISELTFTYNDIIESEIITKGFTKGMFLSSGYIKDPKKEYSLDFFIDSLEYAELFFNVLIHLEKKAFKTKKRNKTLVYLRNSEDIMDLLVMIDSINQFFNYEETTMIKDLRNKTIRQMNWEVANETKVVNTGNIQQKMIKLIDEKLGLSNLTPVLEEVAITRLNYPESSLQEIANIIGISKSGIRNRFRRLEKIYNDLLLEEEEEEEEEQKQ